jgi:hypothetical protein
VSSSLGVSTEKIDAINDYAKSPLFSDAEKVALEYADAITDTHRDVDDELFARMQRHYDDDTIAEITMIIAWENASSRFGRSAFHRKSSGSDDRSAARARPAAFQSSREVARWPASEDFGPLRSGSCEVWRGTTRGPGSRPTVTSTSGATSSTDPRSSLATRLDDQWGSRPVSVAPRRRLGR